MNRDKKEALKEWMLDNLDLSFSRSGGPGGQNVNKVNTKVTARVDIGDLTIFDEIEKNRIREKLSNRITDEDILQIQVSDTRSQLKNREIALIRIISLIEGAIAVPKKRKKTKPSRAAREKRLDNKRKISEKKSRRRDNNQFSQ